MSKYFIIILSIILKMLSFDCKLDVDNVSIDDSKIQYQAEGNLSYVVEQDDMLDSKKNNNEYCNIDLLFTKNNQNIIRLEISFLNPLGTIEYIYSFPTLSFINNETIDFSLSYRPTSSGNSCLELNVTPYSLFNGQEKQLDVLKINFYCVKSSSFYCSSMVSLTSTRSTSFCFLLEDGLIDEEDYDSYVYEEENNYYVSVSSISESNKSIIEGYFNVEVKNGSLHPANGIKTKLNIYQNNSSYQSLNTYIDYTGKFSFEITQQQFSKIELIILSETQYVSIGSDVDHILDTTYSYSLNLTNSITNTLGKKYIIQNMRSFFSNDRGKAMAQAVLMNAAGDCTKAWTGSALPKIPIAFPSENSLHNVDENNNSYLTLSRYGQKDAFHEYGHYFMKHKNFTPPYTGGRHSLSEDLALRYPDIESGSDYRVSKGYSMAFSEGFATFYSYLIQGQVDYYPFSSDWKNDYDKYKSIDINYPGFVLRESNEKTVAHILLSIVDPDFRYNDAIGIVNFFYILKNILNNNATFESLSELLNELSSIPIVNDAVINKALDFYHIAPYDGTLSYNNVTQTSNNPIVYEEYIPTFTWHKGSYVYYNKYLTYKNNGYGDRYTEEEALLDPTVKLHNVGLSNNNFTLYLCDSNGDELLKKENIVDNNISNKTTSYTPTKQEWESIFFTDVFDCYWYVEAYDSNNTVNNGVYKYKSEKYPFILEKIYVEQTPTQSTSGISNLTLSLNLEEIYTVESTRKFKVDINYNWALIPTERLQDFIIMKWSTIYQVNGVMYAVDYYNDGEVYITHSASEFTYSKTNSNMNQMYWVANLIYKTSDNVFPTSLYGNAKIELSSPASATTLLIQVQYHHVTNTATGMAGVYKNEYGEYVTNAYQIESLSKTYSV